MCRWTILSLLPLLSAIGCTPQPITIATEPPGATLQLNGQEIGTSPTAQQIDFGNTKEYELVANKTGFFEAREKLTNDSPGVRARLVKVTLSADEAYTQTVPAEAANHWVRIQVNPQYSQENAWPKLVDLVTGRYGALQQVDPASGYIRSEWSPPKPFTHPTRRTMNVRTQLIGNIASREPLVYKVMIASQVSYGDAPEKWSEYPRIYTDDAKLIADIENRLGGGK